MYNYVTDMEHQLDSSKSESVNYFTLVYSEKMVTITKMYMEAMIIWMLYSKSATITMRVLLISKTTIREDDLRT